MREAYELIERLMYLGGEITIQGERVHIQAPKGALSPQLKKQLKNAKPQIQQLDRWDFKRTLVPNQENPGMVDTWMVGTRIDGEVGHTFWFVEQADA